MRTLLTHIPAVSMLLGSLFITPTVMAQEALSVGKYLEPVDAVSVPDVSGDGVADMAMVYRAANGRVSVIVTNGVSGKKLETLDFGKGYNPKAILSVGDRNYDGVQELAVLGVTAGGLSKYYIRSVKSVQQPGFNGFAVTTNQVAYATGDASAYDAACSTEFGSSWYMADWNTLKKYYAAGASLSDLVYNTGLDSKVNAWVERNGDVSYSSSHDYFVSFHNGSKPAGYADHDNLDDHFLSLGAWNSAYYVLCTDGSTVVPAN